MLSRIQKVLKGEIESKRWYFLMVVLAGYFVLALFDQSRFMLALKFSADVFYKILPVFLVVFVIMLFLNYFIHPVWVKKYLDKSSGWKRWPIAIISGIISTGPIYMWYPMLKDLLKHGVSQGVIAAFLYARAIKPFLLPIMGFYFGWKYVIILTLLMIIFSILQGILIDKLFIYTKKLGG